MRVRYLGYTSAHVEKVCSAWRAGVRRVWGLPLNTHNEYL